MATLRSSDLRLDERPEAGLRCEGTVLIHHDLSTTCTDEHCVAPRESGEWVMAHTRFHGCDYVFRRCPDCAVEPQTPSWLANPEDRAV